MRMDNRMLVSALSLLIISSCLAILGNDTLVSAQEATPPSAVATYNIESGTPDMFEDTAKPARDSALELIDETILRPTEETNTTETVNVEFTNEFGGAATENLIGASATKDHVEEVLNNIIEGLIGSSTSLSFTMKIDSECEPPDCLFKISLQK
jgi:hypothetical protein